MLKPTKFTIEITLILLIKLSLLTMLWLYCIKPYKVKITTAKLAEKMISKQFMEEGDSND